MDIQIVGETEEKKPIVMNEAETTPVLTGDLMIQSIGQMFDLKPTQIAAYKEKIGLLYDYAKSQTEDRSMEGIKWAIRSLQGKVGTPPLGEKWINYLSKYAYLKLENMKMQKEVENYEHND